MLKHFDLKLKTNQIIRYENILIYFRFTFDNDVTQGNNDGKLTVLHISYRHKKAVLYGTAFK